MKKKTLHKDDKEEVLSKIKRTLEKGTKRNIMKRSIART